MRGKLLAIWLGMTLTGSLERAALAQGISTVLLPHLQKTAQVLALGDGAIHLEGLNAVAINPAALTVSQPEAVMQVQLLAQDTQAGMLGAASPVRSLGASQTLGVSYLELRSSGFDKRNESGDASGSFSLQDRLIGLHASRSFQIIEGIEPLDVGLSYKFLTSRIDSYSATARAVDAGLRFRLKSVPLTLGFSARNLGKGPTYIDQESRLPTSYLIAGAYRIVGPLTVTAGFKLLTVEKTDEISVGLEAWARAPLSLRAHYTFVPGGAGGSGTQNLAGGLGLNLHHGFIMDYAFQPFDGSLRAAGAVGTHRMTLTMRFGARQDGERGVRESAWRKPEPASDRIVDAPRDTKPVRDLPRRFEEVPTIRHGASQEPEDLDAARTARNLGLSLAQYLLQTARQAAYDRRYGVAIEKCREVLRMEPRNVRALEILGSVYYHKGDFARAKPLWTRALEINPDNPTLVEYLKRIPEGR